jgi:type IV pilus assembly protein PilN
MPRINLLPWRAELRQKRKKEFLVALLGAALVGGLLVYASKLTVEGWISNQQARNGILKNEISQLDKQIEQIKGLEDQRERLRARIEVIEQLQRSRPEVVHLFDELVNAVPEGVYLTSVTQQDTRIEMTGNAQSSTRVSALMRNIASSKYLTEPVLDIVSAVEKGSVRNANFKLQAREVTMEDEDGAAGDGQAAKGAGAKPKAPAAKTQGAKK